MRMPRTISTANGNFSGPRSEFAEERRVGHVQVLDDEVIERRFTKDCDDEDFVFLDVASSRRGRERSTCEVTPLLIMSKISQNETCASVP